MISDTLSNAAEEIRGYLRDMSHVYAGLKPELTQLLAEMDRLRVMLDAPPSGRPADADAGRAAWTAHETLVVSPDGTIPRP